MREVREMRCSFMVSKELVVGIVAMTSHTSLAVSGAGEPKMKLCLVSC